MTFERLRGKTVVVTGAGRGLGRQLADDFARHGASVCLVSRTRGEIERAGQEIRARGGDAHFVTADVGRGEDVERMIAFARDAMGRIDILVNNAGSFPVGSLVDIDEDEWDQSMRVDLKSFYLCCRAAATTGGMLEAGAGHIINIASVSARRQVPTLSVHCSFKAGVLALSESFRREVAAKGVRVSIVCPGTIDTGLVREPGKRGYVHDSGKWLATSDVSELVLFIASRREQVNLSETTVVGC